MVQGEIEQAIALLTLACREHDDVSELWNNLGVAAARAGRHDEALDAFDKALALEPTDASVFGNRALARVCADDLDGALDDLCTALALDPALPGSWRCKASLHLRRGELRLARHAYQQAAGLAWSHGRPKRHGLALMLAVAALGLVVRFDPKRR